MYDYQKLVNFGEKCGETMMKKSIKDTHKNLEKTVKKLVTKGSTALGPAVASTLGMASKGNPGS